ncbi:hypothetical protein DDD63_09110 [Actinobaculum sp. 313]|nr:hypothetical protein DDD63_09110 [Actinobaculum sp. 313]
MSAMNREPVDSFASLAPALAPWLSAARWHLGSTATPEIRLTLPVARAAGVELHWVVVADGDVTYNVPLTFRESAADEQAVLPAPIAVWENWTVRDATDDPFGQQELLRLITRGPVYSGGTDSSAAGLADTAPVCEKKAGLATHRLCAVQPRTSARRLGREQSNTSIVYDAAPPTSPAADEIGGAAGSPDTPESPHMADTAAAAATTFAGPIILKLFRVLHLGENPDVELQQVLSDSGAVPLQIGSAQLLLHTGHADVLTAQEFLPTATDAWESTTASLATGRPLPREEFVELGRTTRRIHNILAASLPVVEATADKRLQLQDSWLQRARKAINLVPQLAEYTDSIASIFGATQSVPWPPLQRIHGDYHLGQVLRSARGWVVLDFEGEPLRPLAQRRQPDLALRDVAGMLRSFDYAGGTGSEHQEWVSTTQQAFLSGYGALSEEHKVLLRALELDKALYEVAYEAATRPAWLPIPLVGVHRILGAAH